MAQDSLPLFDENDKNSREDYDNIDEIEHEEEEIEHAAPPILSQEEAQTAEEKLPALLEAMIFAAPEPLGLQQIEEVFEKKGLQIKREIICDALASLERKWQSAPSEINSGLVLCQVAGAYVFRTEQAFGPIVKGLFEEKPVRLSKAQLEVLSIVAYRQPVTRMEIEEIRGVDCSAAMRKLLNLKVVKIVGKSEGLGRPLLYSTTKYFLEFFGLNSLHDLPTLKDYQELDKGEKKEDNEPSKGPVTVRDLFADTDNQGMFSAETEEMSVEALKHLDDALGVMDSTTKEINVDAILGSPEKE